MYFFKYTNQKKKKKEGKERVKEKGKKSEISNYLI